MGSFGVNKKITPAGTVPIKRESWKTKSQADIPEKQCQKPGKENLKKRLSIVSNAAGKSPEMRKSLRISHFPKQIFKVMLQC